MDESGRILQRASGWVRGARHVTVLTGAGMSAESGIPTFRDADNGLWQRFDPQQLATPEAFAADPALVWGWYRWRMSKISAAQPHAGHVALATLAQRGRSLSVVTQNVDDLHERAGSRDVVHLHGSLFALRCHACGKPAEAGTATAVSDPTGVATQDATRETRTRDRLATWNGTDEGALREEPPRCGACDGYVRPGVVWFGEALPAEAWERAVAAVQRSNVVLVVGTSGLVYPAAALPGVARANGARLVEINPRASGLAVDLRWPVTAAVGLPALLAQIAG